MIIQRGCKPYEDRMPTTQEERWEPGAQDTELYVWVKYADDAEGNGFVFRSGSAKARALEKAHGLRALILRLIA